MHALSSWREVTLRGDSTPCVQTADSSTSPMLSAASDEELFGPVAAVIRVPDEAQALQVANDTPFGLGAAVFTQASQARVHAQSACAECMRRVHAPAREAPNRT